MPKRKQVKTKGNIRAAEYFNIDISMVRRWVKASSSWLDETNGKKRRLGSGQKP
ncbi:4654_t:CDS:2, partial [Funneliformis geosporum]